MFASGEKVDAIFYLPDKKILPIDSKFPSENFVKYLETQEEDERKKYMKIFLSDVKKRIDEISSKYILPSENTVDYAIMYVPAEAIYYEMINNMSSSILDYA
jgi:DNA recombination protein RmuC